MFVDAYSLPDKSVIDTDVCIIGAGPAGMTLAHELTEEQFRVCVVESGGTAFEGATQALARLASTESDIAPAYQYRRRQLGGNANMWQVGRRPSRSLIRYLPLAGRSWIPTMRVPIACYASASTPIRSPTGPTTVLTRYRSMANRSGRALNGLARQNHF